MTAPSYIIIFNFSFPFAIGDTAIAKLSNVFDAQKFEGCIHEVRSRSILLMFDPKFHDFIVAKFMM